MQALPPPRNVILSADCQCISLSVAVYDLHGIVNTWVPLFCNLIRQFTQPALRLPFICVFPPDRLTPIGIEDRNKDVGILPDWNFVYSGLAVGGLYGPHQRQNDVLSRTGTGSYT